MRRDRRGAPWTRQLRAGQFCAEEDDTAQHRLRNRVSLADLRHVQVKGRRALGRGLPKARDRALAPTCGAAQRRRLDHVWPSSAVVGMDVGTVVGGSARESGQLRGGCAGLRSAVLRKALASRRGWRNRGRDERLAVVWRADDL